jgi:hypothetical protein
LATYNIKMSKKLTVLLGQDSGECRAQATENVLTEPLFALLFSQEKD